MDVEWSKCEALHFKAEGVKLSFRDSPTFLDCCNDRRVQVSPKKDSSFFSANLEPNLDYKHVFAVKMLEVIIMLCKWLPTNQAGLKEAQECPNKSPTIKSQRTFYHSIDEILPSKGLRAPYLPFCLQPVRKGPITFKQSVAKKEQWLIINIWLLDGTLYLSNFLPDVEDVQNDKSFFWLRCITELDCSSTHYATNRKEHF